VGAAHGKLFRAPVMQWIGKTISDRPAKPLVPNVSTSAAYGDGSEVSEWQE